MEKWIVVKFRPRRVPMNDLEFSGKKIRTQDVHYLLFRDESPGKVGVMSGGAPKDAERSVRFRGFRIVEVAR